MIFEVFSFQILTHAFEYFAICGVLGFVYYVCLLFMLSLRRRFNIKFISVVASYMHKYIHRCFLFIKTQSML